MQKDKLIISLISIILIHPLEAFAVSRNLPRGKPTSALYFGFGYSFKNKPAFNFQYEVRNRYGNFGFRYLVIPETVALFPDVVPIEKGYDIGLLYGRQMVKFPYVSIKGYTGISYNTFIRRGKYLGYADFLGISDVYEKILHHCSGVPFCLGVQYDLINTNKAFFFSLQGNINSFSSYWALIFCYVFQ
jgi:hypothetical protein